MKRRHQEALIRRVKRTFIRLMFDFKVKPHHAGWNAAMVLGMSYVFGSDPDVLADVTRLDRAFCVRIIKRCRQIGIWRGQKVRTLDWKAEYSAFSFLLDSMAADGVIDRVPDPKKVAVYKTRSAQRMKAGNCVACGRPNDSGKRTCATCRDAIKARAKQQPPKRVGRFTPKVVAVEPWYQANDETRMTAPEVSR